MHVCSAQWPQSDTVIPLIKRNHIGLYTVRFFSKAALSSCKIFIGTGTSGTNISKFQLAITEFWPPKGNGNTV